MGSPTAKEWLTETKVSPTEPVAIRPRTPAISDRGLETLKTLETHIKNGDTPTQAVTKLPTTRHNTQLLEDLTTGLPLHRALINQPTHFGTRAGVLLKNLGPHLPLTHALQITTAHLQILVEHRKKASSHFQTHALIALSALLMSGALHPSGPTSFLRTLTALGTVASVLTLIALIFTALGTYTTFTLPPLTPYSRYAEQVFARNQLAQAACRAHLPQTATETLLKEAGLASTSEKLPPPPSWLATHILPISAAITIFISVLTIWVRA